MLGPWWNSVEIICFYYVKNKDLPLNISYIYRGLPQISVTFWLTPSSRVMTPFMDSPLNWQYENMTKWQAHNLTIWQAHNLTIWQSDNLSPGCCDEREGGGSPSWKDLWRTWGENRELLDNYGWIWIMCKCWELRIIEPFQCLLSSDLRIIELYPLLFLL